MRLEQEIRPRPSKALMVVGLLCLSFLLGGGGPAATIALLRFGFAPEMTDQRLQNYGTTLSPDLESAIRSETRFERGSMVVISTVATLAFALASMISLYELRREPGNSVFVLLLLVCAGMLVYSAVIAQSSPHLGSKFGSLR